MNSPAATLQPLTLAETIDLERYPINDLNSPKGQALVAFCRAALRFEGACEIPAFFRPEAVQALVAEAKAKESVSFRTDDTHNVYFEPVPEGASSTDPKGVLEHSAKNTIAFDQIDEDSPLKVAYESDEMTDFLGQALEMPSFYRYGDPLGAASLMIFNDGDELGWHFDRSPFAVTAMLQPVEHGGEYQYHHNLRGEGDENPEGVLAALSETQPGRITLNPQAGSLSMFRGQRSLHRVTPVEGGQTRINAVFAYSSKPDDRMNTLTQKLFYGRTA